MHVARRGVSYSVLSEHGPRYARGAVHRERVGIAAIVCCVVSTLQRRNTDLEFCRKPRGAVFKRAASRVTKRAFECDSGLSQSAPSRIHHTAHREEWVDHTWIIRKLHR